MTLQVGSRGVVVASQQAAADAGAFALRHGGNAVDAAIATALALTVVDPANCGLGGYGGFLVVDSPRFAVPQCVHFNTTVPAAFDPRQLRQAPRIEPFVHGGASVSVPAVVPGLFAAHAAGARLPMADLFAPAIALASQGYAVSADLARALRWASSVHGSLSQAFQDLYFRDGRPCREGQSLRVEPVAEVLRLLARRGLAGWREGGLPDAICSSVRGAGGALELADLAGDGVRVEPAQTVEHQGVHVHGADPTGSAFGVLAGALQALQPSRLGAARSAEYLRAVVDALAAAWKQRLAHWQPLVAPSQHTTHLCAADADGTLVACTFTHGPLWFGSALVAGDTGLLLNCGANLYAADRRDGSVQPLTNLCPVFFREPDSTRHVVGSPGGHRIPAIVLQAIVDRVHYAADLEHTLALPRVSTSMAGEPECEAELIDLLPGARRIDTAEYYGPASAITCRSDGTLVAARDPRFGSGLARA